MAKQVPLADQIWAMMVEFRDDFRTKVVEEGWFGRAVTEKLSDIHASLDWAQEQGKEQSPGPAHGKEQTPEMERQSAQERDYGIDR